MWHSYFLNLKCLKDKEIAVMLDSDEYFTRYFNIDVLHITLKLAQKIEGDVGCVVWDASLVLAKYLEELYKKDRQYFKTLNVVELGSGVGCVGLTAASLGAKVLLTDLPDMIPILEKNLELNKEILQLNCGIAQVLQLPWGENLDIAQKPKLILLADCIYYKESVEPLVMTLRNLSGPQTRIILSQEIRQTRKQKSYWNIFLDTIKNYFMYHHIPLQEQNETFRSEDILLLQLIPL